MNEQKPMRLALIGAGAIAQTHSLALRRTASATLTSVVDLNAQAAASIAETHNAAAYTDVDSMLAAGDIDGAIVCTPPVTHPEICIALLERGIHVLCEKPVAIGTSQAIQMFEVAEKSHAKLTMASKFRFVDDVRTAKSLVDSGIIGDVVLFENMFTANVDMSLRWNSDPTIAGGGVLIDNGTHSVDIMRYFLGPLAELQVVEGRRIQKLGVEDTVKMFVRSDAGAMGDIDLSWSINKNQPTYINLFGSEGTVEVGWKESRYRRSQDSDWTVFGHGYDKVQAFVDQLDNFVAASQDDEEFVLKPDDALASVSVVETAYEALRDSKWHKIVGRNESRLSR